MGSMETRGIETLPVRAHATVRAHLERLQAALPGWLVSYHAVGSAALGDFHGEFSDLDFIIAVNGGLTEADDGRLALLHRALHRQCGLAVLDGCYVPVCAVKDGNPTAAGCYRFNGGRYLGRAAFPLHSPDGWVWKKHGILCAGGPPPPYEVDWEALRAGMTQNVELYWKPWAAACRRPLSPKWAGLYLTDGLVEWGVLGVSRLLYSMRERDVASKAAAGRYALETMPARWHGILREALRRRRPEFAPQFRSAVARRNDALAYIEHCAALLGGACV